MPQTDDSKFLQNRYTDEEFDEIAEFDVKSFYDMKASLVRKRKSLCPIEQVAKELGKTPEEMAEFEAYYSDPTLSQIRTYALSLGMKIHIEVEDCEKDCGGKVNNTDEGVSLEDRFEEEDFKKVARHNFHSFDDMKNALVSKRESLCSMEDMARELGCTVDDVAEFEQYWSDPTISEVQEYALALMSTIQIGTNDYDNGFKPYYRAIVPCPAIVETGPFHIFSTISCEKSM